MPYIDVRDFKYGMDRRRPRIAGLPGTLWTLKNAVITRGGDIERVKKWVEEYTLPTGTSGLAGLKGLPYVFGKGTVPGGMPADISYLELTYGGAATLSKIHDAKPFDGKMYVVSEWSDGHIRHFYDGAEITTEWSTVADAQFSYSTVAKALARKINARSDVRAQAVENKVKITAEVAGTAFTLSTSTTDSSNEEQATGTITITGGTSNPGVNKVTQITLDGNNLMTSAVNWATSHSATATAVAAEITSTATNGYTATAVGAVITVLAPVGVGDSINGEDFSVTVGGDVTTTKTAMAGGQDELSVPTASTSTLQANVAAVTEVRATGTVTVTGGSSNPGVNRIAQITVDGNDLLPSPVDWITSNTVTAAAIAAAITSHAEEGYTATSLGAVVTVLAPPGVGATVNTETFTIDNDGDVTTSSVAMSGGVTAVTAVKQISQITISGGYADPTDTWSATVGGTAYAITGRGSAMPLFVHVTKRRVWAPLGSQLRYCKFGDATVWSTTAGSASTDPGFIEMSSDSEGSDDITSLADYNNNTAIFSQTNIRIYALDPDAEAISIVQPVGNTGALAPFASLPFGSTDVFYRDVSGFRSLRSRQGYDAAFASDVGSAIDIYVQELDAEFGEAVVADTRAVIEPRDGRYFAAVGDTMIVLSFFPGASIAAWSEIELEFEPEQLVRIGERIYARDGNKIYVYGGLDGDTWPDAGEYEVDAQMPFVSAQDPAGKKNLMGMDMAGEGDWLVKAYIDPNDETKYVTVGTVNKITYPGEDIALPGHTSHVALRFQSVSEGKCTLSSFALHYLKGETR